MQDTSHDGSDWLCSVYSQGNENPHCKNDRGTKLRSSSYWGWTGGQESVKQVDFKETMGSERLVWESTRSDIINGNSRDKCQYRNKNC